MSCKNCGTGIGRNNKSGYCRKCYSTHATRPDHGAKVSAALRLKYAADPLAKVKAREVAIKNIMSEKAKARRSETARRIELWKIGHAAALSPESRAKAARTRRERHLAWCPPELREQYTRMVHSQHFKAVDAKRMILEQHEADMRRFRRSLGVEGEVAPVEVKLNIYPQNDNPEAGTSIRAEVHKAEKARVDALRVDRRLCPICGTRSDIGCKHSEAA